MQRDADREDDLMWERFKLDIIAAHPELARFVIEELDDPRTKVDEFAPELSDEEMDDLGPLSGEDISEAITALRKFGVFLKDE